MGRVRRDRAFHTDRVVRSYIDYNKLPSRMRRMITRMPQTELESATPTEQQAPQKTYNSSYADIGLEGIETDFTKNLVDKVAPEEHITKKQKLTKMLKIK